MTTTEKTTTIYVPCPDCGGNGYLGATETHPLGTGPCRECLRGGTASCYSAGDTIEIPIAGLGERVTYHAPAAWHERIAALVPVLNFGDHYSRSARERLTDMSREMTPGRHGYTSIAYDYLLAAEHFAAREFGMGELNGLTFAQARALSALCGRYGVPFAAVDFGPSFDLPDGWVAGVVGSIYVGCSPEGGISS